MEYPPKDDGQVAKKQLSFEEHVTTYMYKKESIDQYRYLNEDEAVPNHSYRDKRYGRSVPSRNHFYGCCTVM